MVTCEWKKASGRLEIRYKTICKSSLQDFSIGQKIYKMLSHVLNNSAEENCTILRRKHGLNVTHKTQALGD